jgi:hypothetical protein
MKERFMRDNNAVTEQRRRFSAMEFKPVGPDDDCVFCCTTEPGEACRRCGLPVPIKRIVGL